MSPWVRLPPQAAWARLAALRHLDATLAAVACAVELLALSRDARYRRALFAVIIERLEGARDAVQHILDDEQRRQGPTPIS